MSNLQLAPSLVKAFEVNSKKEEGVWVDWTDTIRIKVARHGGPLYEKELNRAIKPYKNQIKNGVLPEDVAKRVMLRVESRAILVDWEGLHDVEGNEIEYSHEVAYAHLEQLPEFRQMVIDISQTISFYQDEEDNEAEGN